MDKKTILDAIKQAKDNSPKRNFNQTYDLVINLRDIDLKKVQINQFATLHFSKGKKTKVCALVGPELIKQAKEVCDEAISVDDFGKWTDKKKVKKLAVSYDYFIAQATIMAKIASAFGRIFGPKGKMPNPKAGCVVPPNANLKPLYEKLQKTVKVQTKSDPVIRCAIGVEDMKDEEVADNIMTLYDSLVHALPNHEHNIKNAILKLTMGKPINVGEEVKEAPKKEEKKPEPEKPTAEEKKVEVKAKEKKKPKAKKKE